MTHDTPRKGGSAPDPMKSDLGRPAPNKVTSGGDVDGLGTPGGPVTEGSPGTGDETM